MKRIIAALALMTAGAILWAQAAPELPRLAVARFTPNVNSEQVNADATTVRNLVESQMVGTRKYQIVTRDEIDTLLENQRIQMSSISSSENIRKLQLQNISYIVTGSVNAMGGDYVITVNVLDVATGQFSHSVDGFMGSGSRDLYVGISDLITRFDAEMSSAGGGAIAPGQARNTPSNTGIAIEVKTNFGGELYLQDTEIATLRDDDTYTIFIECLGSYRVKMVFSNGTTKTRSINIISNGTVKVDFSLFVIGDQGPGGGIIFFDKGHNSSGWRYLEAAPRSTEFIGQWGAYTKEAPGTNTMIGSGKQNTQRIVSILRSFGEFGRAAQFCDDLDYGGFNDWFLPSKDELALMYTNLRGKSFDDFGYIGYWSSSLNSANGRAWMQSFSDGKQDTNFKNRMNAVRAIRSF